MRQHRPGRLIAILVTLALLIPSARGSRIESAGAPPPPSHPWTLSVVSEEAVAQVADIPQRARQERVGNALQDSLARLVANHSTEHPDGLATFAGLPHVDLAAGTARVILEMAVNPGAHIVGRPTRELLVTPAGGAAELSYAPPVAIGGELAAAIAATGATYETAYENWVQVLAPIGSLEALAGIPDVRAVRLPFFAERQEAPMRGLPEPQSPAAGAQTSEGVSLTNANAWHVRGLTGAGVHLAVFDSGFTGWAARQAAGDLPGGGGLVLHDFSAAYGFGPPGTSGHEHGTACAEIAYDMAPGATMHLYAWDTEVEFANAVSDYITGISGKKAATMSVGWVNAGPYDGTGPINTLINNAQAAGVFWANAAGNFQTAHWSGASVRYGTSDLVTFGSGNVQGYGPEPGTVWNVGAGATLTAFLEWNDWNSARSGNLNHQDYDLYLLQWDGSGWVVAAGSEENQCGTSTPPVETIVYTTSAGGIFGLAIARYTGNGACSNNFGHWLQLYSFNDVFVPGQGSGNLFWYVNPCNSMAIPADGDGAVATGATFWNSDAISPLYGLETFSSFGPRNALGGGNPGGAVNKPDLVALDGVSTATYGSSSGVSFAGGGSGFWGTSGAAPHVAGAAAAAWQGVPGYTASQLRSYLQGQALYKANGGACGGAAAQSAPDSGTLNNRYGWGRLHLGQPPLSSISGRVADGSNQPIAGVTVSAGGARTTTGADGTYILPNLPPGSYSVTPWKNGYSFSPSSRSVTIPPDAAGADFTGTLPDLTVQHIEVNQGVQDRTNGVASVAHKPALVRVYVNIGPHPGPVNGVGGRLTVKQGQAVVAAVDSQQVVAAPVNPNPEKAGETLVFLLDGSYLAGELDLEVTLNPAHSIVESNYANNSQTLRRNFQPRRAVRIGYVPIHYAPTGYVGPQDPGARIAQGDQFLRWIYPLGWNEIEYFPLPPITSTLNVNSGDNDSTLLNDLSDRLNDCNCDYIYGWLPPSVYNGNGLGQRPGHAAFGNDTDGRWRRTFAHELGHNLGALHTQGQSGGDSNAPDTLAPNVDYGINLTTGEVKYRRPDNGLLRDVMVAGELETNAWVTPYFWNLAYQALPPPAAGAGPSAEGEHLVASGVVLRAGGGSLRPLFRVVRPPVTPPAGSDYCLRQEDGAGQLLASDCFDVAFVGDQEMPPDEMPFNITVPWQEGTARVLLMRGDTELDRRLVSEHSPAVEVSVSGGTASWTAGDLDDDPLTYLVLYSHDGGATWQPLSGQITATTFSLDIAHLPGGPNCLVRVRVTDGVNTAYDDSDLFAVGRKPPQAVIYAPEEDAHYFPGAGISLLGRGYDAEDGTLGEAALRWTSDRDGELGTGNQVVVHLSPGRHVITLTVEDSDGNTTAGAVEVYGGTKVYLAVTLR